MRCAVIGSGALGRRHLESLVRSPIDMDIYVIDPIQAAREAAAKHVASLTRGGQGDIVFADTVSEIPKTLDVAILSTNARERLATLKSVLGVGARNLILEKVLFGRLADYDVADALLAEHGARAWVNCARRANPRSAELRGWLSGPLSYAVSGTGWGLGCNVVHHLDELSYLSGSAVSGIDTANLDPGSIPAKREGYREFTGTLRARTERGDTFQASCGAGEAGDRVVQITDGDRTYEISQMTQEMRINDVTGLRREPFPIAFQSEATARHVGDIIGNRAPALPDWKDASRTHRVMISAFLDHMRKTDTMADPDECPIT